MEPTFLDRMTIRNLIKCNYVYLILLSLSSLVTAQQNPSISFISKEQVVEIGDSVELRCTTQYANDYPLTWIKIDPENQNNNLFISRGQTINIPHSRYSVKVENQPSSYYPSATYVLLIDKIQEVDTGKYSCQIIVGTANKITAETDVIVRIPPIISDNSTRSVITTVGSNVDLYCYALGFPRPTISWRREKNKLSVSSCSFY